MAKINDRGEQVSVTSYRVEVRETGRPKTRWRDEIDKYDKVA